MGIMELLIVLLLFIVVIGIANERIFKLQSDISLVLFSLIISVFLLIISKIPGFESFANVINQVGSFKFEAYLLDCVLCFMLFAGASKVNIQKFKQNIKTISLLALITTVISSFIYGGLFFVAARALGINIDIWTCVLLGCIVSPTDPIAATGILNKLGLSKNVTSVIESESLFNDGTGVALFVFVKSLVSHSGESNFLYVMLKEILGALIVAFVVSSIMYKLLSLSKNPVRQILISLLNVSLVYGICEHFVFSGVIASVICGMFFAYKLNGIERRRMVYDPHNLYKIFWEVVDEILNAVLFVMIGISILSVTVSRYWWFVMIFGVVIVILSRFAGVLISSSLIGKNKIPGGYNLMEFVSLMTWSALKGGLSLALAMSTIEILPKDIYVLILNTAYVTIFFTVIIQGLTVKNVYRVIEKHKANRIRKQSGVA